MMISRDEGKLEYNTGVPFAPRDPHAVKIFEQGYRIFAADARQFLKLTDPQARTPYNFVFRQKLSKLIHGGRMQYRSSLLISNKNLLPQKQLQQLFRASRFHGKPGQHLLNRRSRETRLHKLALDLLLGQGFLRPQIHSAPAASSQDLTGNSHPTRNDQTVQSGN